MSLLVITDGNALGSQGPQANTNVCAARLRPVDSATSCSVPPDCRPSSVLAVRNLPPFFSNA